jgi:hypothetical protein
MNALAAWKKMQQKTHSTALLALLACLIASADMQSGCQNARDNQRCSGFFFLVKLRRNLALAL